MKISKKLSNIVNYQILSKYYQENKKRLQEKACERHQNLSKEEKKMWQYGCERYKNPLEDKKINWLSIEKNIIK